MKSRKPTILKKLLKSPLVIITLILILVLLARASFRAYERLQFSRERLAQAEREYRELREREQDLSERVGRLSTEAGIEAELRDKFHAVRKGESVAVIITEEDNSNLLAQATTSSTGLWSRFRLWLGSWI